MPDRKKATIRAPGMLAHHYAPLTPLRLLGEHGEPLRNGGLRIGLLALQVPSDTSDYRAVEVLSKKGDLQEAAANLFAALHRLDAAGLNLIERKKEKRGRP